MTSQIDTYIRQSLWQSGLCVLDAKIAFEISGLWTSLEEASSEFEDLDGLVRRYQGNEGAYVFTWQKRWFPVVTRSLNDLDRRVNYLTGLPICNQGRYDTAEAVQADFNRWERIG